MKLNRSTIWRLGILFAFIAIVGSASVNRPYIFAGNEFLKAFMGPDLVSVLVVVLTITFASVANIHLSISRMIASAPNRRSAEIAANGVRYQINSNAWLIFWAFAVALVALFLYGEFPCNVTVRAVMMAVCMTVVVLNGLVMHDLYRTIFLLVANSPFGETNSDRQDFSDEGPPAE